MWRRLFHLGGTSLCPALALLLPKEIFLLILTIGTFFSLGLEYGRLIISPSLNQRFISQFKVRVRPQENSQPLGSTYIFLSSLLLFLLFEKEIAVLAISFLAVGDPIAGIVGERFRGRGKSLEGTVACFLACLLVGIFLSKTILPIGIPLIVIGSLSAALVELLPLKINDNLTIPLLAATTMTAIGLI